MFPGFLLIDLHQIRNFNFNFNLHFILSSKYLGIFFCYFKKSYNCIEIRYDSLIRKWFILAENIFPQIERKKEEKRRKGKEKKGREQKVWKLEDETLIGREEGKKEEQSIWISNIHGQLTFDVKNEIWNMKNG